MNASAQSKIHGMDRALGGGLLRALIAGGILVLLWKAMRGIGTLFWTLFGLAMAVFWSGAWRWLA